MHYLSYFPDQLRNFGPLRHHSCFRFEAKNGLITTLNYKNFINIAYSCANKHQFWMASKEIEFRNKNSLAYHDDICQVSKQIVDQTHHDNLQKNKYINCVKYLKLNGFVYYPGAYLIIDLTLKESSSVGLIDTILNVDGQTVFYL